jgi:hypothetical protein
MNPGVSQLTISHVELDAEQNGAIELAVRNTYGGHLTMDHVYQHGRIDAMCHCGDADISDSYSKVAQWIPNDHIENMYVSNQTDTVTHNTFINTEPQTANIFMDSGGGNHLTAKNNLFAGGGFSMYVCPKDGCNTATATVTGNMFTRCAHGNEVSGPGGQWLCRNGADNYGMFPRSGSFGYAAYLPVQTVWSGNVWDDDGSPVPHP